MKYRVTLNNTDIDEDAPLADLPVFVSDVEANSPEEAFDGACEMLQIAMRQKGYKIDRSGG